MVNILYCGNERVFDGILTCTLSMLMRTNSPEPFTFYLFTMDVSDISPQYTPITERQRSLLEEAVCRYNRENRVILTDVTALYRAYFSGCPNEGAYCSPYTLIRLLADLVDEIPDKLLYLDADVMLHRDVHLLYDVDVSAVEYAAARDYYGKFLVYPNYINAGVLLLNMQTIRKTGLFVRAREILRAKRLTFADQSALIRATSKKKIISQRCNDQKLLHKNTIVRHFSKRLFWLPYPHVDNVKQWQIERVHRVFGYHQFDDVYEEYLNIKQCLEEEKRI